MASKQFTAEEILYLLIGKSDARGAITVGAYLRALLARLWKEKALFRGKDPFGNSGWEYTLYNALAQAGAIKAVKDDATGGWIIGDAAIAKADALIMKAIKALR